MHAKEAIQFALTASLSLHQMMHRSHVTDTLRTAGRTTHPAKAYD